jgi:hypothetical protein
MATGIVVDGGVAPFPLPPEHEPVFVNLIRSPGINSQPGWRVLQRYFKCRSTRIHSLAETIPWLLKTFKKWARFLAPIEYLKIPGHNTG